MKNFYNDTLGAWRRNFPEEQAAANKRGGKASIYDDGTTDTVRLKSVKDGCEIKVRQSSFDNVARPKEHGCTCEKKRHNDFLPYPSAKYDEEKMKLDKSQLLTCPRCKKTLSHKFKPGRVCRTCPKRQGGCGFGFRA